MKNNRILTIFISVSFFLLSSCGNSFLEISPKNLQTEESAFQTNDNFKTYAWGLYTIFDANRLMNADLTSHLMSNNSSNNGNIYAQQKVTESNENGSWDYTFIRRVNVLLANIDKPNKLSETDKKHWKSVGLFFRSYKYFDMLSKYGDIPWVEKVVQETDENILYGPREKRDVVAANIFRDLKFAEENIKDAGDGKNTINKSVVQALISRFCLFEGTWRKYHGLTDPSTYLNNCVTYSEKAMIANPSINSSYDLIFNTGDLASTPGVLLYWSYVEGVLTHSLMRSYSKASSNSVELTKQAVDLYLCTDGKPISNSPMSSGDKTPYDEFRNRDYRLVFTVAPPHRVYKSGAATSMEWRYLTTSDDIKIGANPSRKVTPAEVVIFREYMDLLAKISSPTQKSLPFNAWNNTLATSYLPRFRNFSEGIAPSSGQHGYWLWKWYDNNPAFQASNFTDQPIFRIEETMLNYAEAKAELGTFKQPDADLTINKLRKRVNVANMNVADINDAFDPKRDQTVPALIWEIRRERSVELMAEGFSFDDLRRWEKGTYLNQQLLGSWQKNADFNNSLIIQGYGTVAASKDKEGYVQFLAAPVGWLDTYYLYPVPLKELVLNPQLTQNPGYKTPTP